MMHPNREAGFTLLETIVAFLVLALVAGAFQLCLGGGWRGLTAVRGEERALQLAKAKLAETGVDQPLGDGIEEGQTDDGYAWSREVRRHAPSGEVRVERGSIAGYWVKISVRWSPGRARADREVALSTLKLGGAP